MTLFEKNMDALAKRNPRFTREIREKHQPRGDLEILETPSGEPTARLGGQFLHSSRNPRREAAKLFLQDKERPDILILQGFALGYHAEEFLRIHSQGEIWILEPDIPLFLAVCALRDLTALLRNPRTTLLLAPRASSLGALTANLPEHRFAIAKVRSVYEKDREYYEEADRAIENALEQRRINRNTLNRFGPLWVRNLLHNLPLLTGASGVRRLEGILEDIPALVLAAGPSLEELLPLLGDLRDRMAIVAVDTALYALNRAGIVPDFLVVVDPQYFNSRYLDGLHCRNSFLVAESSTHPRIFRTDPRGIFFGESSFPLGKALEGGTDIEGRLGAGGSVATAAWEVARFTGAREIYCGGLDLGFPDNLSHQKDSFFERRALYTAHRLSPLEEAGFSAIRNGAPYWAENNSGGKTLSDRRMMVYARWFEGRIASTSVRTFNLSARGIAVQGMSHRVAADLLGLPRCRGEIKNRLGRLDTAPPPPEPHFYRSLKKVKEDLEVMEGLAQRGISLLEGIEGLIGKQDIGQAHHLKDRLEELDRLDRKILGTSARRVVGFLFQDLIDELSRGEEAPNRPGEEETEEDRLRPIHNSRRLYEGILSSSGYHLGLLKNALQRMGLS